MPRTKQGKTRDVNNPYEVWVIRADGQILWEWRVLKKYQAPEAEAENQYARWFCAVKSPHTMGRYEMGDSYVNDVTLYGEVAHRESTQSAADSWTADWYTPARW